MTATDVALVERAGLIRRGKRLEYATVAYNGLEGIVAVGAGLLAASVALVGFGFDSGIEVISGLALLWRLSVDSDTENRERIALRIVGLSFLLLAAYVAYDAGRSLLLGERPHESPIGIALAALSLVVMPWLARAKRRVASAIGSAALRADARQTELCAYLSAILLGGLVLNAVAGWWWADPVAALVMVPIIAREGLAAVRGDRCDGCCP